MSDKNDVVIINLDRPRELRFGHKAIKTLAALTGKDLEATLNMEHLDLEELEKVMYCGLLTDAKNNNEVLKLEGMEDLLDACPSYQELINKLQESFNKAFGNFGDVQEKNLKRIADKKRP